MKKRDKKLVLHRETLHRLGAKELEPGALAKAQGALDDFGPQTSCVKPDCCGTE